MSFSVGFICGLILGGIAVHLIHEYLDSLLPKGDEPIETPANSCPPCTGECQQGRFCPWKSPK